MNLNLHVYAILCSNVVLLVKLNLVGLLFGL